MRDLCKLKIWCGNGGPYHLMSSEIRFVSHVLRVLRELIFPLSWLDSSFWDRFDSFLLC
jgi:hypothetical protein